MALPTAWRLVKASGRRVSDVQRPCQSCRFFSDILPPGGGRGDDRPLRLTFAVACSPHPAKVKTGGEDGYFACAHSRSFGVADGVGGWAESGVDPGAFARALLRYAHEALWGRRHLGGEAQLEEALWAAFAQIGVERIRGGSTALLGHLHGSRLSILNLGDSGVIVLRPAFRKPPHAEQPLIFPRVMLRSSDQTHYFNCPYQLGSGAPPSEVPDLLTVRVRAGDLVIAGTDGVFDNLFDHQVQALAAQTMGSSWRSQLGAESCLQDLATGIVQQAQRIGRLEDQKDVLTPFALSAHSEGLNFRGGKLDDTTVVVALVCHAQQPTAESAEVANDESEKKCLPSLCNF